MDIGKDCWLLIIKKIDGLSKVRLTQVSKSFRKLVYNNLENISMDVIIENNMFLEMKNIDWHNYWSYVLEDVLLYIIDYKSKPLIRYYLNLMSNNNPYNKYNYIKNYIRAMNFEPIIDITLTNINTFNISAIFRNHEASFKIAIYLINSGEKINNIIHTYNFYCNNKATANIFRIVLARISFF